KITGVPSRCDTIESCGQAFTQSLHLVHRSRNSASPTAPGGRSQSVRVGAAGLSGAASTCAAYSFAAFATERTESLKKSRRPYFGSEAISWQFHIQISDLRSEIFSSYITPSARSL